MANNPSLLRIARFAQPLDADLLLNYKVPGVREIHFHERALFDRLLAAQERMSEEILGLLDRPQRPVLSSTNGNS